MDQQPGADADFALPCDQGSHRCKRRQDARHREEVPRAKGPRKGSGPVALASINPAETAMASPFRD